MSKDEAIELISGILDIAYDLLKQLSESKLEVSYSDKFFIGLLIRKRSILRDSLYVLKNHHDLEISSVFILYRTLLDDFIRTFSVYASPTNIEEEIIKIEADAHNHWYKNLKEQVEINNKYYNGNNPTLPTDNTYLTEKEKFLSDVSNDIFFEDKALFKFKKITPIARVFEIMSKDVKTISNAHAYVVYKFLTQYVHYSNITFLLNNTVESRKLEINQIEEIMLYTYKELLMHYDFLKDKYNLKWKDEKIMTHFDSRTLSV